MSNKEILIGVKIQVNNEKAIRKIVESQKQIDELKKKQTELTEAFKEGAISEEEYRKGMEEYRTQIEQSAFKVRALRKEIQNNLRIEEEQKGSLKQLRAALSNLTAEYDRLSQAEREATKGKRLEDKINGVTKALKGAEEETGRYYRNVGNYDNAIKEAIGLNSDFAKTLFEIAEGGTGATTKIKAFGKTLLSLIKSPSFMAVAGIVGVGSAFKWWYDYNAGLVEATRLTKQLTGLSGNELKHFRNEVQAISDTFGKDFRETLNTANALTRQFGISTDEAVSLLKEGLISGADVSGEFLQNVREYSTFFKEAGLNADEFIAIVSQTNKDGLFSDKGIDAIKEATIRLREMTTATSTALENIGLDSKQVQKDLVSGSKTIFDVIREISARLGELPENSAAVGAAIADIFGSPGEDAGLQYLKTLKDIDTSMQTVIKSSGELGELQRARINSEIELQNAISEFADITGGTFEALQSKIKTGWNATMTDIVKTINSQIKRVKGMFDFVGGLMDGLKGEPIPLTPKEKPTFTIQEPKGEALNDTDPNILTPEQRKIRDRKEREENEKRMKMLQERQKKEIAALRALRDAENSLIEDSAEKQRATINASYDDQIEDLKRYLETEGNLTPKAKAAVNETIDRLNKKRTADLAKVNEKEMRNQLQQEADYIRQKLELSTEGDYQEYDLKAKLLKKEMEIELSNTELTTEQKKLIEERYQKKLDEMTSEHEREKQEKAMKAFELELSNRLAEAKIAGEDELQVELENAKKRLDSLQQLEGESDAEFKARQLEAQQEYLDAQQAIADREVEIQRTKYEAIEQITGALSGLFEELGESNKTFTILSKTLALAEIAINTGKAISSAVAASAGKGLFGLAEIATLVTTIISNMTAAIGIVNSAKFAKGGLVEGSGTGTSDSIPAMLSNGESVITARATSMFSPILSYINQAGGGAPIVVEKGSQAMGEDMIARAVAKGIKGIQPVVSVTEINKVGSQVNVVENLGDR
ncbi:phage tail tape measure protein [Barnesiella intestinihominis]|uniref:phage tail tape measure protein n=1 Tax=Barnesiella intestinihominis TaxID=487174 RepID=UPI002673C10E|nr:phage tail tape measure protein [Barnesiella intestinihominis]